MRLVSIALVCALTAGCGGGGTSLAPSPFSPSPVTPTTAPAPAPNSVTEAVADSASVAIPQANGFSGSIAFPATGVPSGESITITNLATAPAGLPPTVSDASRSPDGRVRSPLASAPATLVAPYLTFTFPITLTLPASPAFSITPFPSVASERFAAVVFDVTNASAATQVFITTGSVVKQGSTSSLEFPAVDFSPAGLTFTQGHTYAFGIYAQGAAPQPTQSPSNAPTTVPTVSPTTAPTTAPTVVPTTTPTTTPTVAPTTAPTTTPTVAPTATPTVAPTASPAPASASTTVPILPGGGTLAFPAFGGFTGSIGYPSNGSPAGTTATLTTSTTNLGGTLPSPSGADSVFFEQLQLNSSASSVTFNGGSASATLSSSSLLSSKTYTLNVYVNFFGSNQLFTSTNLGVPVNGSLSFMSPFSGTQVPTGAAVTLDLQQN